MRPETIAVPEELSSPHQLLVQSLPLLRQARDLREDLLERETCLAVTVQTHALLSRALRIMDTLLKALEARGFSIEVTTPHASPADSYGRRTITPSATRARSGETAIRFGIHEGSDRVPVGPERRPGIFDTYVPRPEYKSVPNGRLSLCIYSYHPGCARQTWTDGKRQRLESCLGRFVHAASVIVETERLERLSRERREAEQERVRREAEERERQRARETARVKDLERRILDWRNAQSIVDLAAAIERNARAHGEPLDPGSGMAEWLAWARARADGLERRALGGPDSETDS